MKPKLFVVLVVVLAGLLLVDLGTPGAASPNVPAGCHPRDLILSDLSGYEAISPEDLPGLGSGSGTSADMAAFYKLDGHHILMLNLIAYGSSAEASSANGKYVDASLDMEPTLVGEATVLAHSASYSGTYEGRDVRLHESAAGRFVVGLMLIQMGEVSDSIALTLGEELALWLQTETIPEICLADLGSDASQLPYEGAYQAGRFFARLIVPGLLITALILGFRKFSSR